MEFNKDHKVKVETLTEEELVFFEAFLIDELIRHSLNVEEARLRKALYPAIASIYDSAIIRHKDDIKGIDATLRKLSGG